MAIQNANTSGQGFDPFHINTPLHALIVSFGYTYSHSTPVRFAEGVHILHCYKRGDHNVSTDESEDGGVHWSTSTSCASGRQWTGTGPTQLRKHLKGKRSRYPELR